MFRKGVLIELSDLPNAQGKNSEFSLNCDNFMDFCCIVTFIIFLNSYYRPVCFFPITIFLLTYILLSTEILMQQTCWATWISVQEIFVSNSQFDRNLFNSKIQSLAPFYLVYIKQKFKCENCSDRNLHLIIYSTISVTSGLIWSSKPYKYRAASS